MGARKLSCSRLASLKVLACMLSPERMTSKRKTNCDHGRMSQITSFAGAALLYATVSGITTLNLQPHTIQAFESYSRAANERIAQQVQSAVFLWAVADP